MDRHKRPAFTRHGMMRGIVLLALLPALLLAGCSSRSYVQASSSGSPSTGVSTSGSVYVQGQSALAALIAIGVLAGASYRSDRETPPLAPTPELDASRRVLEHDCTKPIVDWSANLKCK